MKKIVKEQRNVPYLLNNLPQSNSKLTFNKMSLKWTKTEALLKLLSEISGYLKASLGV